MLRSCSGQVVTSQNAGSRILMTISFMTFDVIIIFIVHQSSAGIASRVSSKIEFCVWWGGCLYFVWSLCGNTHSLAYRHCDRNGICRWSFTVQKGSQVSVKLVQKISGWYTSTVSALQSHCRERDCGRGEGRDLWSRLGDLGGSWTWRTRYWLPSVSFRNTSKKKWGIRSGYRLNFLLCHLFISSVKPSFRCTRA